MKHLSQMLEALGLRIVPLGAEKRETDDLGHRVEGGVLASISDAGSFYGCDIGDAVLIIEDSFFSEQIDEVDGEAGRHGGNDLQLSCIESENFLGHGSSPEFSDARKP